jgi:hypothetical protein
MKLLNTYIIYSIHSLLSQNQNQDQYIYVLKRHEKCIWAILLVDKFMVLILYTLRVALSVSTTQPISLSLFVLSSCRWRNVQNGALSHCRLVVLSLAKHAKRRVVVRRVVAMLPCRLVYLCIQSFDLSRAVRLACIVSNRTTTIKSDNAQFGV